MKRGLTIVEVMLAAALLMYAVYAFTSVYASTARYEVHSQNRVLAAILGENYMDEAEAHPFGEPAPSDWFLDSWTTVGMRQLVEGRRLDNTFHVRRSVLNGSCTRPDGDKDWDVVRVVISWREGGRQRDGAPADYFENDNQHLIVQIPVWR